MRLFRLSLDRFPSRSFPPTSPNPNPRQRDTRSTFDRTLPSRFSAGSGSFRGPFQWGIHQNRARREVRELPGMPSTDWAPRNGASGFFLFEKELQSPTLLEFVPSERVKVVAMLGLALALCNADRVVMSVVIVPLSKARGWSQSFSGIVQGYFVILSWMPVYFNTESCMVQCTPMVHDGCFRLYAAGAVSDMLIRIGLSVTSTRKIMQSIGFVGPAIALFGLNAAKNPTVASAWLSTAVGLSSFSHSGFLVNFQEIAPKYAGVLHGMSNTAGTLAAIMGTIGAGFFFQKKGSFRGFIVLTSVLYLLSALFWDIFATGEHVEFDTVV